MFEDLRADMQCGRDMLVLIHGYNVSWEEAVGSAAALEATCLQHIARFKRPKRYHFVDSLPKNNYGKVLKTALRELLNQGENPC